MFASVFDDLHNLRSRWPSCMLMFARNIHYLGIHVDVTQLKTAQPPPPPAPPSPMPPAMPPVSSNAGMQSALQLRHEGRLSSRQLPLV